MNACCRGVPVHLPVWQARFETAQKALDEFLAQDYKAA